jgi:hypothetical protein
MAQPPEQADGTAAGETLLFPEEGRDGHEVIRIRSVSQPKKESGSQYNEV